MQLHQTITPTGDPACPPVGAGPPEAGSRRKGEAGMVTAETAVVLPVLLVVLAMALFVLACVAGQLRCVDAARAAARLAARDEPPAAVSAAALALAPSAAAVRLQRSPGTVQVTVSAVVQPWGSLLGRLPGVAVSASATAAREDSLGSAALDGSGSGPSPVLQPPVRHGPR